LDEFVRQLFEIQQSLRTLSIGHFEEFGFDPRRGQRVQQHFCTMTPDGRNGYHKGAAAAEKLAQTISGMR
jgi:hypothetical protein